MICGNFPAEESFFEYRSSYFLTEFFSDIETDYEHDGSTRALWVMHTLEDILKEPTSAPHTPPQTFSRVIQSLMDKADAKNEDTSRAGALAQLNLALARDQFEAFYAEDGHCYLRHTATNVVAQPAANPHRPFSRLEYAKREELTNFLNHASEDSMIENVLLPLFRQLGFHRITAAGHKDKALEYGKDIWMKYTLPTQNVLYFGIQAKKGKLDASGVTNARNANMAEIYNQTLMMLGHEVFDSDLGKRTLVDHAFIVAGGQITKQARNWLGNKLDANKRSQVMFLDRDDLINLFVVTNLPVPSASWPQASTPREEPPF